MLGKAVIRQGWGSGRLSASRRSVGARGRAESFGDGGGDTGRSPPHRPQRVDVDEAGGIGGLVVPLHVHAAERKAVSPLWGRGFGLCTGIAGRLELHGHEQPGHGTMGTFTGCPGSPL